MATNYTLLRPARTLAEIADTLLKQPLETPEELNAFYSDKYGSARGVDRIRHLEVELGHSFQRMPFHGLVMGHPGVGKSTEISRLLLRSQSYRAIRITAAGELSPGDFHIHHLLWLMILRILTETKSPVITGFSNELSPGLLEDVQKELSTRLVKTLGISDKEVEGGLNLKLFAKIRATLKITRQRVEETVEYSYPALTDLIDVVNRIFDECNTLLRREKGQEWILVVEDFEKLGVDPERLRHLFFSYRPLLEQLKCHLLFVIPVGLAYSEDAEKMPFGPQRQFMIPDIAVYCRGDRLADENGIGALVDVVYRRVEPALLNETLARGLAIASGGNLRDLFELLGRAGIAAEARGGARIERCDASEAVEALRLSYRLRLGESDYSGPNSVPLKKKINKLLEVHRREPGVRIPDKTLYVLLRQRMVLQFNGEGWFGVHPLVVDILKETESIKPGEPGGTDLSGD